MVFERASGGRKSSARAVSITDQHSTWTIKTFRHRSNAFMYNTRQDRNTFSHLDFAPVGFASTGRLVHPETGSSSAWRSVISS